MFDIYSNSPDYRNRAVADGITPNRVNYEYITLVGMKCPKHDECPAIVCNDTWMVETDVLRIEGEYGPYYAEHDIPALIGLFGIFNGIPGIPGEYYEMGRESAIYAIQAIMCVTWAQAANVLFKCNFTSKVIFGDVMVMRDITHNSDKYTLQRA